MRQILAFYLFLLCTLMSAQSSDIQLVDYMPYYGDNHILYDEIDRLDVKQDTFHNIHTSIKKLGPTDLNQLSVHLNEQPNKALMPLRSCKGLFSTFYKKPHRFYENLGKNFCFGINPIAHFRAGKESNSGDFIFLNKRGIELMGILDQKLYFYTSFQENQSNFFDYQEDFIETYKSVRGQGNYKAYQSSVIDSIKGYDYALATAYLGYKLSKHSRLELGHGRHFIGNGMRSLLLSDSGANYFYLKFAVQFWRIHYQVIWAELSSIPAALTPNNNVLPKKYMAAHYLSYKPLQNLEIGFFESIVFSRENQFELQYLNPVIFYRTVEFQLDSPDNVLLGLNVKWNLFNRFTLYGQVLLDELNLGLLRSEDQWWGNKFGFQYGLKYFDMLGIKKLYGQVEINRVRPFTYSHRKPVEDFPQFSISNYSHYSQPLAHPAGANFTEYIAKVRYQPLEKLTLELRYLHTKLGRNTDDNFGSDILVPDITRVADFGVSQHQGALSTINMFNLTASYELLSNLYLDLEFVERKDDNKELISYSNRYFGMGFRYNISNTSIDY